jgi:putative membrane protein
MRGLLIRWVIWLAALELAAWLLPDRLMRLEHVGPALLAAFLLSLLNALVRPVLKVLNLLALPINILTLGLFALILAFVMNALLLWAVGRWIGGFEVQGAAGALAGAAIMSVVTAIRGRARTPAALGGMR